MFWVQCGFIALVTGSLFVPAILSATPQWTVYYALLWGLMGLGALVAHRWPATLTRLLQVAGPALAVIVLIQRAALGRVAFPYNENATASLLLLLFPWHWSRNWILAGLCLSGLACTGSAGALLAAVAAISLLIARSIQLEKGMVWWSLPLIVAGSAIIAGVAIAALQPATSAARLEHWQAAWDLWQARVWTGWGPGSYLVVSPIPDQNHADNLWLTVGAEMGSLGFALVGTLSLYILWRILHTAHNPARLAMLAWLMHQAIDCTLFFPMVGLAVALNLGLLWRCENVGVETAIDRAEDTLDHPGNGIPGSIGRLGPLNGIHADPK